MSDAEVEADTGAEDEDGLVPAQWFVRLAGLGMLAVAAAALAGSLDDIKRYLRIKQM